MAYSRPRMDALTDGVFSIAMTLLVLEVKLPEAVAKGEFAQALAEAAPRLWIYALSFVSLGLVWLGRALLRDAPDELSRGEANLTLFYLLLVTLVPFSSMAVGRFNHEPMAIWLYCANLGAIGVASAGLRYMAPPAPGDEGRGRRLGSSLLLAASAGLAAALVPIAPDGQSLWALAANLLGPSIDRLLAKRKA